MTLKDLETALKVLKPGQMASLPYSVYEILFPPGEPDERARERAYNFAKQYGCVIETRVAEEQVWFKKPK